MAVTTGMSHDVTARFFHWMNAHNISRSQAAELLGVDERSLSTYRGRGLPKKQNARAEQVMREHAATKDPAIPLTDENRISVNFTDEQYTLVEKAAGIVECGTKEFIQKAACDEAKRYIKLDEEKRIKEFPPIGSKVAENPDDLRVIHSQKPNTKYREGNG